MNIGSIVLRCMLAAEFLFFGAAKIVAVASIRTRAEHARPADRTVLIAATAVFMSGNFPVASRSCQLSEIFIPSND